MLAEVLQPAGEDSEHGVTCQDAPSEGCVRKKFSLWYLSNAAEASWGDTCGPRSVMGLGCCRRVAASHGMLCVACLVMHLEGDGCELLLRWSSLCCVRCSCGRSIEASGRGGRMRSMLEDELLWQYMQQWCTVAGLLAPCIL